MEKQTIVFMVIILFSLFFMTIELANGSSNNNNSVIFAQGKNITRQMMPMGQTTATTGMWEFVPTMTNWIGIFSLGMMAALLAFKTNNSSNIETQRSSSSIIISIAILSMAVGTIHILLIHEHIQASFWWVYSF